MKKILAALLSLTLILSLTAVSFAETELKTIRIGATAAPHAEILQSDAVTAKLAELGYKLDVVVYDGYTLENPAVSDGTDDANYFQHQPYLDSYNATVPEEDQLVAAFAVHYEPFGIYSSTLTDLADLPDGATVALPNDPSNETRAMLLLAAAGLITVPEGSNAQSTLTQYDITAEMNPKGLKFNEMDASLLAVTLADSDIAVINGNYAIDGGLKPATDALVLEASDSDFATLYANIVTIRKADVDADWVKALKTAICTDEVKTFMEQYNGGVVPMF